jgi:hypothetical protein
MLLAKEATSGESRQAFLTLAQTWTKLATELEAAEPVIRATRQKEPESRAFKAH